VGVTDGTHFAANVTHMRITCGNLKGGVGKTTSAAFLACGLARSGRTLLVDADPFGSLLDWSQVEPGNGSSAWAGFPATVIAWPVKDLARRVQGVADDYDHIVIDTGPNHEQLLRQALAVSDLLLIPCAPTLMDVERLGETFALVEDVQPLRPIEARVLFTKAPAMSADLRDARQGLAEQGFPVLDAHVRALVHYSRARGTVPDELLDYEAVLAEIATVRVG
jgi:chromosome partitioning protein